MQIYWWSAEKLTANILSWQLGWFSASKEMAHHKLHKALATWDILVCGIS